MLTFKFHRTWGWMLGGIVALSLTGAQHAPSADPPFTFPYAEAGWTPEEAAVHLLNRFTFGPRPNDVADVLTHGLEAWFADQLEALYPDAALTAQLERLPAHGLSAEDMSKQFPAPVLLRARMVREGLLSRDRSELSEEETRNAMRKYAEENGLRPQRQLIQEMNAQKLFRARYSENQLQEVLTDFWFNHFNVSITDNAARGYVYAYERDAIRPYVLGSFRAMLEATAKHPAMLLYLDNAQSIAPVNTKTTADYTVARYRESGFMPRDMDRQAAQFQRRRARDMQMGNMDPALQSQLEERRRQRGVNENYARELLELHTLGVDGGYTQDDVEAVARAFTGWSMVPANVENERALQRIEQSKRIGSFTEGLFLFRADAHDATEKTILGQTFPAGRGIEDGNDVLDLVAQHPATARHLAYKLAAAFVADLPPESLVDRLSTVFLETQGDLKTMMMALATAPEFWDKSVYLSRIKSPFRLVVSTLRALEADVQGASRPLFERLRDMGQPLYAYQAPTGYPDTAESWINSGALMHRMNWGTDLAARKIRGIRFDFAALNGDETLSGEAALAHYADLLLPERDLTATLTRLQPLLTTASTKTAEAPTEAEQVFPGMQAAAEPAPMSAAQVIGILLGSPAFQRY